MNKYDHRWVRGEAIALPVTKALCVGRNYAAHAAELNNPIPSTPVLFLKPATAFQHLEHPITWPRQLGRCDHELELALLIGSGDEDAPEAKVVAVALALDLTLREVQQDLKQAGHPWERAKAFPGACPISPWIPLANVGDPMQLEFSLTVNGAMRQQGKAANMLFSIPDLLQEIHQTFSLIPGDVVLTGTPAGVQGLQPGDQLELALSAATGAHWCWNTEVMVASTS